MIGRLHQIVPPWYVMLSLLALFAAFEGPLLYAEWKFGGPILDLKVRPGTAILLISAAYYGVHRAASLHPFYREDYRAWLELTPWTVEKPLPLGPIDLIWEDGLILGALMLLSLSQPVHQSVRILNLFLIAHATCLTASFWQTGAGVVGYLSAFGILLAIRLWPSPWICFPVATSVYLLVYEGVRQSLARFPWRL